MKFIGKYPSRFPLALFLAICSSFAIAPTIYAATDANLTRQASAAIALLLLTAIAISIYLFVVIFQPERF